MDNPEIVLQKTGKRVKRPKKIKISPQFRLFDFNVITKQEENDMSSDSEEGGSSWQPDTDKFVIQTFGINEKGETASIVIEGFNPFFYISVSDSWKENDPRLYEFLANLRDQAWRVSEKSWLMK